MGHMLIFTHVVAVALICSFYIWVFFSIRLKPFLIACLVSFLTILIVSTIIFSLEYFLHLPKKHVQLGPFDAGTYTRAFLPGSIEELTRALLGAYFIALFYKKQIITRQTLIHIIISIAVIYASIEQFGTLQFLTKFSRIVSLNDPSNLWKLPVLGFGFAIWALGHFLVHYCLLSLSLNLAIHRLWGWLIAIALSHGAFNILMGLNPVAYNSIKSLYINLAIKLSYVFLLYIVIKKTKIGAVVRGPYPDDALVLDKPA